MLKITKAKNEMNSYDFKIESEENTLGIIFGGNGDLYFYVKKNNDEEKQIINFEITKENYVLYKLFESLYDQIINCDIYSLDEYELDFYDAEELEEKRIMHQEWNDDLKQSSVYKNLVKDGIISWRHDDQIYEQANILNIHKEDEKYRLEFVEQTEEWSIFLDVRFRNSGSRYSPFNMAFMDFYHELQKYDPEYHQIHMEEYLYQKRLELKHK